MSDLNRTIICTICARGGSKGVKGKNLRVLHGKPLIAHTIGQAQASGISETIAVTSDSPEILKAAERCGIKYCIKRPDELASDTADKLEAIRHCILEVEKKLGKTCDVILDLDPTSPLREVSDIQAALKLFYERGAENLITAAPSRRSPYFNLVEQNENGWVSLSKALPQRVYRRQDSPKCFDMNASIYIWKRSCLFEKKRVFCEETALYVMPPERSHDIDEEIDFKIVEMLMSEKQGN